MNPIRESLPCVLVFILLISRHIKIWYILYQEHGNLQPVVVQVIQHRITESDGIITVCDAQRYCGDLKITDRNSSDFMNYHYPINSTFSCFQHEKRPDVFSLDDRPIFYADRQMTIHFGCVCIAIFIAFTLGILYADPRYLQIRM